MLFCVHPSRCAIFECPQVVAVQASSSALSVMALRVSFYNVGFVTGDALAKEDARLQFEDEIGRLMSLSQMVVLCEIGDHEDGLPLDYKTILEEVVADLNASRSFRVVESYGVLLAPDIGAPVLRLSPVSAEHRLWHEYVEFQLQCIGFSVCVRGIHIPQGSRHFVSNKPAVLRRLAAIPCSSVVLLIGGDLFLTSQDKKKLTKKECRRRGQSLSCASVRLQYRREGLLSQSFASDPREC